jgi:hypothetical protein
MSFVLVVQALRRGWRSGAAAVKRHQLLDVIQKASDTGVRQIL